MIEIIIFNLMGFQYYFKKGIKINLIKSNKKNEILYTNKIIFLKKKNQKGLFGKPFLNNLNLKISLIYKCILKKNIFKFKRRKRYKIIKKSKNFLFEIKLIKLINGKEESCRIGKER
ncbi:hypothetical protein [Candidatus Vidania fulgoroideorum]